MLVLLQLYSNNPLEVFPLALVEMPMFLQTLDQACYLYYFLRAKILVGSNLIFCSLYSIKVCTVAVNVVVLFDVVILDSFNIFNELHLRNLWGQVLRFAYIVLMEIRHCYITKNAIALKSDILILSVLNSEVHAAQRS